MAGEIDDNQYTRLCEEQKARFEAVPADLRAAILKVLKDYDSDNFSMGRDEEQLANFLDDLSRNGLEIAWKR